MAHVLVVEDDASISWMLEVLLTSDGHDVEVIARGDEARTRLDAPPPDVAVLDVMLPGLDGLGVLRELRERESWSGVGVVVVSALTTDHDVRAGRTAGADLYLTKPFDPTALAEAVDRLAAGAPLP